MRMPRIGDRHGDRLIGKVGPDKRDRFGTTRCTQYIAVDASAYSRQSVGGEPAHVVLPGNNPTAQIRHIECRRSVAGAVNCADCSKEWSKDRA